jgi:hypothetical protein
MSKFRRCFKNAPLNLVKNYRQIVKREQKWVKFVYSSAELTSHKRRERGGL